jgi:hypothetical protein
MLSFRPIPEYRQEAHVAKRVRGKGSSYRPGGQGPSRSKESQSPESVANADVVTLDPIDIAIDSAVEPVPVEVDTAEISVAAPAAVARKPKAARRSARAKADSLEGRAAAEETWVRTDLRRIAIISAIMVAGLAVAWVLFVALNLAGLY